MRSRSDIRATGAVYTPHSVANAVLEFALGVSKSGPLAILEPSVGDGAFIHRFQNSADSLTLIDIDESAVDALANCFAHQNAKFIVSDFLKFAIECKQSQAEHFDIVVGNPPFIRKHNFSSDFRKTLSVFADVFDYPLAALKNSWAAFLVAATELVDQEAGVVAFVLPYEVMTVEYGQKLLKSLRSRFQRIDLFISATKAFADIEQDAVIFVGRMEAKPKTSGMFVSRLESFDELDPSGGFMVAPNFDVDPSLQLNGYLLPDGSVEMLSTIRKSSTSLSDFADSAPGVVSAANDFFILTDDEVERHQLSDNVLPILKKGSLAGPSPIFTQSDFGRLSKSIPCQLLSIKGAKDTLNDALLKYVEIGESAGIQNRYKCRHRKNWYEVPLVKPEVGFFFKRSHSHPRMIVNDAGVYITDTAYGLRIKSGYTVRGLCFSFYNSLTMLFAEIEGRFYGGGVLELSPTEFRKLPLTYLEPTEAQWLEFLKVHEAASGNADKILDFGDKQLLANGSYSRDDIKMLRNCWRIIRTHRMRHGGRLKAGHSDLAPGSAET